MMEFAIPVSHVLVFLICLFLAPEDAKSLRIDAIGPDGFVAAYVAEKDDNVWTISEEIGVEKTVFFTIEAKGDDRALFSVRAGRDGKTAETLSLSQQLVDFEASNWQNEQRGWIDVVAGGQVKFDRSGDLLYVTAVGSSITYVIREP
jgi:hypothetical protein